MAYPRNHVQGSEGRMKLGIRSMHLKIGPLPAFHYCSDDEYGIVAAEPLVARSRNHDRFAATRIAGRSGVDGGVEADAFADSTDLLKADLARLTVAPLKNV